MVSFFIKTSTQKLITPTSENFFDGYTISVLFLSLVFFSNFHNFERGIVVQMILPSSYFVLAFGFLRDVTIDGDGCFCKCEWMSIAEIERLSNVHKRALKLFATFYVDWKA